MKAIELTQEHKDKLLEMCKILFPEYINVEIELEPDYEGLQYFIQLNKTDKIKEWIYIHWFEFCFTILADKIFTKYIEKAQFVIDTWAGNPIDYLYDEFKKLKTTEYKKPLSIEKKT